MRPSPDVIVIAILAVGQGLLAVLRSLQLVRFGSDLVGRGVLLLPFAGVLTIARGVLIAGIAILYIMFAWGALKRRRWAPAVGFGAVLLNAFAIVNALIAGEPLARALPWAVVPVVLLLYLLSPARRRAVAR
jgi:hypothetical protein